MIVGRRKTEDTSGFGIGPGIFSDKLKILPLNPLFHFPPGYHVLRRPLFPGLGIPDAPVGVQQSQCTLYLGCTDAFGPHQKKTLYHILKLPNIPRPFVMGKNLKGFFFNNGQLCPGSGFSSDEMGWKFTRTRLDELKSCLQDSDIELMILSAALFRLRVGVNADAQRIRFLSDRQLD
jgi:hypothetical protein